eukprot:TRINITY_DN279_c0_g12_i1.p1 TRINITY_DN279_c0_g12~~TRINITY_DN279_c0_g12_i1.p1  ORF type:complete len:544 (-),score=120.20 TRINITY_DN279_c0_g12_i1:144-1775(-)
MQKVMKKEMSNDRLTTYFVYTAGMMVFLTLIYGYLHPLGLFGGTPLCTAWCIGVVTSLLLLYRFELKRNQRSIAWTQFILSWLLPLSVPVFFEGSNIINRARYKQVGGDMLYDLAFLRLDDFFLGWLYPKGQMALWLDNSSILGPTTTLGCWMVEIFQIMYVSYYFWGNAIALYLMWQYFYVCVYKGYGSNDYKLVQWRRMQMFMTAWVSTYLLNFFCHLVFPAVSPRIYLEDEYRHNRLNGIFLGDLLRNAISSAASQSYSVFPSGHCSMSLLAASLAHRLGFRVYSYIAGTAAVLICLATQILRYHYFSDFLFAWVLVGFGLFFGGFFLRTSFPHYLMQPFLEGEPDSCSSSIPPSFGSSSSSPSASLLSSVSVSLYPSAFSVSSSLSSSSSALSLSSSSSSSVTAATSSSSSSTTATTGLELDILNSVRSIHRCNNNDKTNTDDTHFSSSSSPLLSIGGAYDHTNNNNNNTRDDVGRFSLSNDGGRYTYDAFLREGALLSSKGLTRLQLDCSCFRRYLNAIVKKKESSSLAANSNIATCQ